MIIVYNIKIYLSSSMEDNAKSMGDRRKIKKGQKCLSNNDYWKLWAGNI